MQDRSRLRFSKVDEPKVIRGKGSKTARKEIYNRHRKETQITNKGGSTSDKREKGAGIRGENTYIGQ